MIGVFDEQVEQDRHGVHVLHEGQRTASEGPHQSPHRGEAGHPPEADGTPNAGPGHGWWEEPLLWWWRQEFRRRRWWPWVPQPILVQRKERNDRPRKRRWEEDFPLLKPRILETSFMLGFRKVFFLGKDLDVRA